MNSVKTERANGTTILTTFGDRVISLEVSIPGSLQSMRDKEFSARMSHVSNMKIARAGDVWFARLLSLDVHGPLRRLQAQCGLEGVCIGLEAKVRKKVPARDYKDRLGGFDHMILDPLVRGGVLMDDDEGNIFIHGVLRNLTPGPDLLEIRFDISTVPCRPSVTEQMQIFGWPDPEFRTRPKAERMKELKAKLRTKTQTGVLL